MAAPGGQGQARSPSEEKVPEKQGFFSQVKDSLNFSNPMGFTTDLDSPAAKAALAEAREREEREGVTEVVPQAPLSERLKEGVNGVAATAAEVVTGASGAVHPVHKETSGQDKSVAEEALPDETIRHREGDVSGVGEKKQEDVSDASVTKEADPKTEADPETEKDGHSFYKWAKHTAHKLGNAVASKELSEDLLSKKTTKK